MDQLLTQLDEAGSQWSRWLAAVAAEHRASARNYKHIWAIRQNDLRDLACASRARDRNAEITRAAPHHHQRADAPTHLPDPVDDEKTLLPSKHSRSRFMDNVALGYAVNRSTL